MNDAGVRLHHERLTGERLRVAIRTAIGKRPGAERIARAFASAGGPAAAASAVLAELDAVSARPVTSDLRGNGVWGAN